MHQHILLFSFWLFSIAAFSQDTLSVSKDSLQVHEKITIGAYIDGYYGYNSTRSENLEIPYFVSMNRDNEFSINLAFLDLKYSDDRVRARFAPGFGSYMNANYISEKGAFKNIVEASIGFKLHPKKEIWLDAGVLSSPFTNETAISKDHLMYTRSLAADYVPYYLCGAKLSIVIKKKLTAALYAVNGWQQIIDQNKDKSLAFQLEFKPNAKNLFNWDVYAGNERTLIYSTYMNRYFTDVYWTHNLFGKWSFSSCVFLGFQEITGTKTTDNLWYQANFMGRYRFGAKSSLSARLELFSDYNGIVSASINPNENGLKTAGFGLCYNLQVTNKLLYRLEARSFFSDENHFEGENTFINTAYWFISSLVFSLNN